MKNLIETLSEVRDDVSTLDDLYHKVATLRTLRKGARGVTRAASAVSESAREIETEREYLLEVAEGLLETVTALELAEQQARADEKAQLQEQFLAGIEQVLTMLVEGVEEELARREELDDDDVDVEESCGASHKKKKRVKKRMSEAEFEEACARNKKRKRKGVVEDEDERNEPEASDLTLDAFLDGVVHEIQQEGIEDHDMAVGLLSSTVYELVEEGLLPEVPEYEDGPEEATVWAARAIELDLPGLVTHLARSVDSE